MPTHVHFYAGHADGITLSMPEVPKVHDFPTAKGDRCPQGKPFTRYVHSEIWSAHFERPTLIPSGYPGKPPKQKQAA